MAGGAATPLLPLTRMFENLGRSLESCLGKDPTQGVLPPPKGFSAF